MLGLFGHYQFRSQLETRWHRLYRVAYSWCHDIQLASDLVQEVFAKALKKRHQLRDTKALDVWLFTIMTNCWRDHCRQQRDMVDVDDVSLVQESYPEEENDRNKVITRVRTAITKLSHDQRQIVTLVDLEGLSYGEVAEVLGIPVGTVMSRLCRARQNLKKYLHDLEYEIKESSPKIRRIK